MVGPGEIARRARGRRTGRLESLPILVMNVHSACNCHCVMCDIWKANAEKREISSDDLARYADEIRALHVQRVVLSGGEPLLHRNLWALCAELQALRIRVTLVTTGLLVEHYAADIASCIDTVVISLDGPRGVHDAIRRVKGGFDRISAGVMALRAQLPPPRLIAQCVVQRDNALAIESTIGAAHRMGFDEISFVAADVFSTAFNRPDPWPPLRAGEVAIGEGEVAALEASIAEATDAHGELFDHGFVAGGRDSLARVLQYCRALAGGGDFPPVNCNVPWVSSVLEPGGVLRPCLFHRSYGVASEGIDDTLNGERAIAFRRELDVASDATCRRCVCPQNVSLTAKV